MEKETRNSKIAAKVEKNSNGVIGKIHGYAAVFNSDSEDMGFIERIAPGAFKAALKKSDVRALKNHDQNLIFGRQNVNLKLKEDKTGLYYEASPLDTRNYSETAEEIASGLLTGQSFAFIIESEEWKDLDKDKPIRTITKIREVFDVGPVTYPAYQDTTVALRSLEAAKAESFDSEDETENIVIKDGEVEYVFKDFEQVERVFDALNDIKKAQNPEYTQDPGHPNSRTTEEGDQEEALSNNRTIKRDPLSTDEIEKQYDLNKRYKK